MASEDGQPEKGEQEPRHQAWANYKPGRAGYGSPGSMSYGYGDQWNAQDQWSMAHRWYNMNPWTFSQGGMGPGQGYQWQSMPGSSASSSGDQWSSRAWTSQDVTPSRPMEPTVSSNEENRKTRTTVVGASTQQRRTPPPPPPPKAPPRIMSPSAPPPGGPSAGGGKRATPNPKKPADDAWKNVEVPQRGVPYPDTRGMKSRPYDPDGGRLYPELEENLVVYRSEIGNGTYPLSSVPVLCDVTGDRHAFPYDTTWLRTRNMRRHQERQVLFEGTGWRNPDVIPTCEVDEFRDRPEPPWYDYQFRCYYEMMRVTYDDPIKSRLLNYYCYVCKKGPESKTR
eukprot:6034968-Amphidinium_carterae.1